MEISEGLMPDGGNEEQPTTYTPAFVPSHPVHLCDCVSQKPIPSEQNQLTIMFLPCSPSKGTRNDARGIEDRKTPLKFVSLVIHSDQVGTPRDQSGFEDAQDKSRSYQAGKVFCQSLANCSNACAYVQCKFHNQHALPKSSYQSR